MPSPDLTTAAGEANQATATGTTSGGTHTTDPTDLDTNGTTPTSSGTTAVVPTPGTCYTLWSNASGTYIAELPTVNGPPVVVLTVSGYIPPLTNDLVLFDGYWWNCGIVNQVAIHATTGIANHMYGQHCPTAMVLDGKLMLRNNLSAGTYDEYATSTAALAGQANNTVDPGWPYFPGASTVDEAGDLLYLTTTAPDRFYVVDMTTGLDSEVVFASGFDGPVYGLALGQTGLLRVLDDGRIDPTYTIRVRDVNTITGAEVSAIEIGTFPADQMHGLWCAPPTPP
jgi:hypothetical protein